MKRHIPDPARVTRDLRCHLVGHALCGKRINFGACDQGKLRDEATRAARTFGQAAFMKENERKAKIWCLTCLYNFKPTEGSDG